MDDEGSISGRLVAYTSSLADSSVKRAALLAGLKIRHLDVDESKSLRGQTLAKAMHEDQEEGRIPFFVVATLGTTSCCSYDNLLELGEVCNQREVWLHVDAAYAGSAFICPEYRPILNGVELADSFNFNPHKWLLVNFDCSCLWVKDATHFTRGYGVDPVYLKVSIDFT